MASTRPSTANNFSEIENLIQALGKQKKLTDNGKSSELQQTPEPHPKSKSSHQTEPAPQVSTQEELGLSQQWEGLIQSGAADEENDVQQPKKKRKVTNRNTGGSRQKKKPSGTPANRKAVQRKVQLGRKQVVPEESLSVPDTNSDEDDTNDFLEHLKKLTEQKKKSQAAKLARANKRTLAEMDKLGFQSKAEAQKIAVETSKAIAGHCDALQAQVKELEKEVQSQSAECVRVKSEAVESMKQMLERSKSINARMQELVDQFKQRCIAIAEQAEKDVQAEQERIQKKMRARAVVDRKLKKLQDLVQSK